MEILYIGDFSILIYLIFLYKDERMNFYFILLSYNTIPLYFCFNFGHWKFFQLAPMTLWPVERFCDNKKNMGVASGKLKDFDLEIAIFWNTDELAPELAPGFSCPYQGH